MPKGIYTRTEQGRMNQSKAHMNYSVEVRRKMSLAKKGKPSNSLGKNWKLSEERIQQIKYNVTGAKHSKWKGEDASYVSKHLWMKRFFGSPMVCENCKITAPTTRHIHWANLSRKYKRERSDWVRLCVKCHYRYDRGLLELKLLEDKSKTNE